VSERSLEVIAAGVLLPFEILAAPWAIEDLIRRALIDALAGAKIL